MADAESNCGPKLMEEIVDNEDSGITMLDVLEEEQELEENANAVLGGSDDQNCTYIQGYVKRQALYACRTCSTSDMEPGGLCLACSYACHEGHDLYELYTKRNFRCDCGNSRFPNNSCTLYEKKDPLNVNNSYNHNFRGMYCTCNRPYPDPDDEVPDEMIQCIMCEDWYHGRHLGGIVQSTSDFSEMICLTCMNNYPFLQAYYVNIPKFIVKNEPGANPDKDAVVEVEKLLFEDVKKDLDVSGDQKAEEKPLLAQTNAKPEDSTIGNKDDKSSEEDSDECKLKEYEKRPHTFQGPAFWPESWRRKLCCCSSCMEMYAQLKVQFLFDDDDTVHAYEERGKASTSCETQYDRGLSALQKMDRVQQVEAIHEYNNMKSELKEYLKKFAASKRVVKEEDIREFFEQMQARKRQKTATGYSIPFYCR